jgi:hypothetical protein
MKAAVLAALYRDHSPTVASAGTDATSTRGIIAARVGQWRGSYCLTAPWVLSRGSDDPDAFDVQREKRRRVPPYLLNDDEWET